MIDQVELEIISPDDNQFSFYEGENKTLIYYLQNNTDHTVRDIEFSAKTQLYDGSKYQNTKKSNYLQIGTLPAAILSRQKESVQVIVNMPMKYNEIIKHNGKDLVVPFEIVVAAKCRKYIESLR